MFVALVAMVAGVLTVTAPDIAVARTQKSVSADVASLNTLAAMARRDPTRAIRATIKFGQQLAPNARGDAVVRSVPSKGIVEMVGTYRNRGAEITAGYTVRGGDGAVQRYYDAQLNSMRAVLRRLERRSASTEGTRRRAVQRSTVTVRQFLRALAARRPLKMRQRGTYAISDLLAASRAGVIERIDFSGRGPRSKQGARTSRRATALQAPIAEEYMPRLWSAGTSLVDEGFDGSPLPPPIPPPPPPFTVGEFEKLTWIDVMWDRPGSLDWYHGDDAGQRGIELEGFPTSNDEEWSETWGHGGEGWASNFPDAYRDDMFEDQETDERVAHFAIGSANGRALDMNTFYWAEYQTDRGKTDNGNVRLRGQAVRRAASDEPLNLAYCALHQTDAACMFAETTETVVNYSDGALGEYPLGGGGDWQHYAPPPTPLPPPEIFFGGCNGIVRADADGGNQTVINASLGPVAPDGQSLVGWAPGNKVGRYSRTGVFQGIVYTPPSGSSIKGWDFEPSGDALWMGRNQVDQDTTDIYRLDLVSRAVNSLKKSGE